MNWMWDFFFVFTYISLWHYLSRVSHPTVEIHSSKKAALSPSLASPFPDVWSTTSGNYTGMGYLHGNRLSASAGLTASYRSMKSSPEKSGITILSPALGMCRFNELREIQNKGGAYYFFRGGIALKRVGPRTCDII